MAGDAGADEEGAVREVRVPCEDFGAGGVGAGGFGGGGGGGGARASVLGCGVGVGGVLFYDAEFCVGGGRGGEGFVVFEANLKGGGRRYLSIE